MYKKVLTSILISILVIVTLVIYLMKGSIPFSRVLSGKKETLFTLDETKIESKVTSNKEINIFALTVAKENNTFSHYAYMGKSEIASTTCHVVLNLLSGNRTISLSSQNGVSLDPGKGACTLFTLTEDEKQLLLDYFSYYENGEKVYDQMLGAFSMQRNKDTLYVEPPSGYVVSTLFTICTPILKDLI